MAEDQDSSQEKTEEPTARRLEQAREKGQVARSRELATMLLVFGGTLMMMALASPLADRLMAILVFNFTLDRAAIFDPAQMLIHLGASLRDVGLVLVLFLGGLMLIGIIAYIAVGGWLMAGEALQPKFSRMNPLSGLKRMFSVKSLIELVKAVAKIVLVGGFAYLMLSLFMQPILNLAREPVEAAIGGALWILSLCVLGIAFALVVIAAIDVPFQIWDHTRQLKMTFQEIKDEMKDTEGRPEVKGRIRQLQREMAQRRMLDEVPNADVVITNPTHYAVALKYEPEKSDAPYLVAKGVDHMAALIREKARISEVVIVEAPALARAVYANTRINQAIPQGLFLAVAQVLAYVYQLKRYRPGQGSRPQPPSHLDVPDELDPKNRAADGDDES